MPTEKEQTKKNKAKIIISTDDELTDLLRKISFLKDDNVLLTFAENSDLLISPINLKVLQEVCDDFKKNIILQIIQNPIGVRNAKIANMITTESPSDIDDELWLIAEKKRLAREEKKINALKNIRGGNTKNKEEVKEAIQNLEQETPVLQDSEYQNRIEEVINKSKELIKNDKKNIIQEDDWTFAIGQDIEDMNKEKNKELSLIGKNFNNINELKKIDDGRKGLMSGFSKRNIDKKPKKEKLKEEIKEKDFETPKKKEKKQPKPKNKQDIKKKITLFLILFIGTLGVTGVFGYNTLPLVRIDIYIESKSIEVEKILKSNSNIKELDLENGEIPIKKEELTISRSDHAYTTGTGVRGEKAEGVIILKYWEGGATTIPAGTTISKNNLSFETTRSVDIPDAPNTTQGIPVRAVTPGADHNLNAGNLFVVSGFGAELTAENKTAFSGGLSEEYSKFTQQDYDKLLEVLQTDAFESGKKQINETNPEWKLIEETVTQEIDGDVNTDVPIDGEANLFNMDLSTKTIGLYFNEEEILNAKEKIIKQAAIERDLFKSDENINLELDPDIETNITIEQIDGDSITIKFTAKGYIRVNLNSEKIQNSLAGKSWEEGNSILKKIEFSEKSPKIEFLPEYFPKSLRHFPKKENRIIIETKLLETEIIREENEENIEN